MKTLLAAAVIVAASVSSSYALSPECEAFMATMKPALDPKSEKVRSADAEGAIETTFRGDAVSFSLDGLCKEKRANGVRAFIATRAFIHKLEKDPSTPMLKEYYDGQYLTNEQRMLVVKKLSDAA